MTFVRSLLQKTWGTASGELLFKMEKENEIQKRHEVGIILGHMYTGFGYTGRQKRRMEKGCELFKEGQVERLMTTGGKGMWRKTAPSMAEVARDYLMKRQRIEATSLLVERESTTTRENAEYALRLMQAGLFNSRQPEVLKKKQKDQSLLK